MNHWHRYRRDAEGYSEPLAPLQKKCRRIQGTIGTATEETQKDTGNHWHLYRRNVEGYREPLAPLQMKCRRIQ